MSFTWDYENNFDGKQHICIDCKSTDKSNVYPIVDDFRKQTSCEESSR